MGKENEFIYSIVTKNTELAIIIRKYRVSNRLNITSFKEVLQASILSLGKYNEVAPHKHTSMKREIFGTQEIWIVKKGRGLVSFYDLNDEFLCSKVIAKGDMLLNLRGGHGLKSLSRELLFIEIKNGPYLGSKNDKISISS